MCSDKLLGCYRLRLIPGRPEFRKVPIFRYYVISLGSNSAVAELVVICVAFHYPKPELRFYLANIPVKLRASTSRNVANRVRVGSQRAEW